jgi:hypothetical protein
MSNIDSITFDDIEIDLGDYGAAPQSSTMIDTLDTITITGLSNQYSSMNTITLPSSNTITYGGNTITGSSGQFYTSTGTGHNNWNNVTTASSSVNITSNGIDMAAGTDITVDGKSLKEFMNKMEQRLAILVPDPKKLEQFAALKKAYEHYKLMESLCQEPPKED